MRKNRVKKLQLRPRLVTGITAGFIIVSTLVSSMAVVNNGINVRRIEEAKGREIDSVKAMGEVDTSNWDLNRVNIVYDRRWNTGACA